MKMKSVLLLLFLTLSANAELENLVQINDNLNSTAQKSPSIASDDKGNIYSIWIDYRNNKLGEIFFSKSEDSGKTWSENKFIFNSDIPNSKFQRYATLKTHGDNLYVCWMSTVNAKIEVFFCKSTDKGETFTNPLIVSDDNSKYNQDFPVMNVDDNGGIHIAAIDNRNHEQGKVSFAELMYTHSTDEGETWSPNKIISNFNVNAGACECCWPALDTYTDTDGNVTVSVLYRSNINNLRVSYLANSYDGGLNFEQPRRVGFEDWIIDFCPVSGPSIEYDNSGKLHMTYKTISDIYYSSFDSNNPTNNETHIASGDNPGLVFNEHTGRVYISYENYESNRLQTRIVEVSQSNNVSSSDLILPMNSDISMSNLDMIFSNEKVYMNWEGETEGNENSNIWFAEYISKLSSVEYSINASAIKTNNEGNLIISTNEFNTKLVISDLMGKILIEQELNIPVKDYIVDLSQLNFKVLLSNIISPRGNTSRIIIK
jgi:hypothetical protein